MARVVRVHTLELTGFLQGWKYAGQRSTPHKRHPFLISYRELAEEAKASGRTFAEYLLKYLLVRRHAGMRGV